MNISLLRNSLVLAALCVVASSSAVDSSLKSAGQKCVSLVFDDSYEAAHREADALIKKSPKSPAGYFLKAAVYHHQMKDLGSTTFATPFYAICDQGAKFGEASTSEWDRFFGAATLGIRGAYERSQNRLVTSLKLGWRAIDVFRPLKDQGNIDALYGVAVYDYWVGANAKALFWMENVKDERPRALTDLIKVSQNGVFTSRVVLYDLLEMYADEKKYAKVQATAETILSKHPSNTVALEYQFWSLVKQSKFSEAKVSLEKRSAALSARNAPKARFQKLESDKKMISGK